MDGSIYSLTKGTLALRYVEHETIHPIALISTANWARYSLAYSLLLQGRFPIMISTSELGRDIPIALLPNRIA